MIFRVWVLLKPCGDLEEAIFILSSGGEHHTNSTCVETLKVSESLRKTTLKKKYWASMHRSGETSESHFSYEITISLQLQNPPMIYY